MSRQPVDSKKGALAFTFLIAALFALCLCACGNTGNDSDSQGEMSDGVTDTQASQISGATSVMEQTDEAGLVEETGISLPAPSEATDVSYYIYKLDEDNSIAEMRYTLNGKKLTLRAQSTVLTSFSLTAQEYVDALNNNSNAANEADISGLYYVWETGSDVTVSERPAQCFTSSADGGVGLIMWLDAVPGILYSLSTDAGTVVTADELVSLAQTSFVPLQDEVG